MDRIKYDAFNAAPFNNHIPEMEILANKKSLNIILGVIAAGAFCVFVYKLHEYYKDEREK